MMVYLKRGGGLLAAELHDPVPWIDRATGKRTSYLAGFPDPDAMDKARRYAAGKGWRVIE